MLVVPRNIGQDPAIVQRRGASPISEGAAVNKDEHGERLRGLRRERDADVEVETILLGY
jgi:hypothetical protein